MKRPIRVCCWMVTMSIAVFLLMGCSPSADDAHSGVTNSLAGKQSVTLVYVEWASCAAATHVVKAVLEQQGYHVTTLSVSGAAMYEALAQGDADATVCAWLPSTHANYYARTKDQLVDLGANMQGTRIGLAVPDYVTIDSIEQLAAHADKFQHQMIGIDPGAGEMDIAHRAMDAYKLPMTLVSGSSAAMTAALKNAIDHQRWIVVTAWTPHWIWSRWQLKYLADPRNVFGGAEHIDTLVRKGFAQDHAEAYTILSRFHWTAQDMQQVMAADQKEDADPVADARQWVIAHPRLVSSWVAGH